MKRQILSLLFLPLLTMFTGGAVGSVLLVDSNMSQANPELPYPTELEKSLPYNVMLSYLGLLSAKQGDTLTLQVTITNTGTNPNSYTVSSQPSVSWVMSNLPSTVSLASGASTTINWSVTIPLNAPIGTVGQIPLLVQSTNGPAIDETTAQITVSAKP